MKSTVILDSFKEDEIRTRAVFDQYFEILKQDIDAIFTDVHTYQKIVCPSCESENSTFAFSKFGFNYVECQKCLSLYVNPRPTEDQLRSYYAHGKAIQFWRNSLIQEQDLTRQRRIYAPLVYWINNAIISHGVEENCLIDFYPKYDGFLKELSLKTNFKRKILLNPLFNSKENDEFEKIFTSNFQENKFENIKADVVILFETLERVLDVSLLMHQAYASLKPGGLLCVVTSSSSGFDLQVLWEKSQKIYPPDHLNFLSIDGMVTLMKKFNFKILELSTPGLLDVDIVLNAMKDDESFVPSRFLKKLIKTKDVLVREDFQNFLQRNRLSSHVRLIARKEPV